MENTRQIPICPIVFEDKREELSVMHGWTERLCDEDHMRLHSVEEVSPFGYNSFALDNVIGREEDSVKLISYNRDVASYGEEQEVIAYHCQKGKSRAYLEADLEKEKRKERTCVMHGFMDYGFARGKNFSDGTKMINVVATARIDQVRRWKIGDKEYVKLLVTDTTSKYIQSEMVWTEVFEISDLGKDIFVEKLVSRYFNPSDSRVYNPAALKDFRARIYEMIRSTEIEEVWQTSGWYRLGEKQVYYDGTNYPMDGHILACLKRNCSNYNVGAVEVLERICNELNKFEVGNRLAFLIGYGLTTWLAEVCSCKWNGCPGIMLLGKRNVCRRYADACLKMYGRVSGPDIIELAGVDKKTLIEYVEVLKDDAMVIDCEDITKVDLKLAKVILSGKTIANHSITVPIVAIHNIPDDELVYEDFVTIDLNGFVVSESFISSMQQLKAMLLSVFESGVYSDDEKVDKFPVSYDEAARMVFSNVKQQLISVGVSKEPVNRFIARLEAGLRAGGCLVGDEKITLKNMFQQRIEQLIATGHVCMTGDISIGKTTEQKNSIIVKEGEVYIPAKYLDEVLLGLMNISKGTFRRIRQVLIGQQLLTTYNVEKNYTKRITISNGERIYAYEMDIEMFPVIKNMVAEWKEDIR